MPEAVPDGTLLGFDFGTRRIGVAVGQTATGTARALKTVATKDEAALDRVIAEWKPCALVVGLPLDLSGEESDMSKNARRFARSLQERHELPVFLTDERLTSVEARARFAEHRSRGGARRKDAALMDAMAAQLILESFLSEQR